MRFNFSQRFFIFLCWTAAVFSMIIMPMPVYEGNTVTYYDKVIHAIMFGGFAFLFVYAFSAFKKYNLKLLILISILLGTLNAGFSEYIQEFVPGRTVSELDFLGGMIGIFISALLSYEIFKK